MKLLEIACFSLHSAQVAAEAGVDRIEFCAGREVGGTTPLREEVERLIQLTAIPIPIRIMIRPRGGDFVYSAAEFEQMKSEILSFQDMPIDGFVFGILNRDLTIDVARNAELVALAGQKTCTFHRAFDALPNLSDGLEQLIELGFSTILTSGGAPDATRGIENLAKLVHQSSGRIELLVGGGVRSTNLAELIQQTQAQAYHSSGITIGTEVDTEEIKRLKELLVGN
jgi:copper homeostasis protein